MKKILLFSATVMALAFTSCKREQPEEPWGDATYKVASYDDTRYDLNRGKSKEIALYVTSANGYTDPNNIDVTVFADESKVEDFNKGRDTAATMLPLDAYSFDKTTVKIYRYNTNSITFKATVTILNDEKMAEGHYVLPIGINSIEGSKTAAAAEKNTLYIHIVKLHSAVDKGDGTKERPYLIYEKKDIWDMRDECLKQGQTDDARGDTTICTYFKMMKDIDMGMTREDETKWVPINYDGQYDRKINFDGDGHSISNFVCTNCTYASFFGVVYGVVKNVTFINPIVENVPATGILGAYIGTQGKTATNNYFPKQSIVENVHIVNGFLKTTNDANGAGGIAGRMFGSRLSRCSFDGRIEGGKMIGGLIGYDDGKDKTNREIANLMERRSIINDCSVSGVIYVPNGGQRVGGVIGCLRSDYTEIRRCFVNAGIMGNMCVGGIGGHCNWDANGVQNPYNTISKCIVWCDSLTARNGGTANYGNGAVAGFCAPTSTCEDCYRRPDLEIIAKDATATEFFKFVDQPNSSATSPQQVGIECDYSTTYKIPYNGKAAAAGKTASDVAQDLGWDQSIWDLSGDIPVLRK